MRKFKMGIATIVTTAAVLVPTGAATAGPLDPLQICSGPNACRDASVVEVGDVTVCGLNIDVINAILLGQQNEATCTSGSEQGNTVKKKLAQEASAEPSNAASA